MKAAEACPVNWSRRAEMNVVGSAGGKAELSFLQPSGDQLRKSSAGREMSCPILQLEGAQGSPHLTKIRHLESGVFQCGKGAPDLRASVLGQKQPRASQERGLIH